MNFRLLTRSADSKCIPPRWVRAIAMIAVIFPTLLLTCQSAIAQPSARPSFDCSKASGRVEVMICRDPSLASADALMARLFVATKVSAFGEGPSSEPEAQRKWLKDRSTACTGVKLAEQPACLVRFLNSRNEELAVAALFAEPELALDTLHRLDPAAAPLLEAVYRFALEPPDTDWRSPSMTEKRGSLLRLLEPYAARFKTEEDLGYGRDILKDDHIESAGDALTSDDSFATFVAITSAYIPDGPIPRSIPCAALVRNPDLIGMEGPLFGSTLDNFIVSADCPDTLPPAPQLIALVNQINDHWPPCEGTIRFAAYRNFGSAVDAALLGTGQHVTKQRLERMPRLAGVSPRQVRAAITELTNYYRQYGRASGPRAPALATASVRALMRAGHSCD